jgi:hypothetical protein
VHQILAYRFEIGDILRSLQSIHGVAVPQLVWRLAWYIDSLKITYHTNSDSISRRQASKKARPVEGGSDCGPHGSELAHMGLSWKAPRAVGAVKSLGPC